MNEFPSPCEDGDVTRPERDEMSEWLVLECRPDLIRLVGIQANWFFAENMFVQGSASDYRVKVKRIRRGYDDAVNIGMIDGVLPIV